MNTIGRRTARALTLVLTLVSIASCQKTAPPAEPPAASEPVPVVSHVKFITIYADSSGKCHLTLPSVIHVAEGDTLLWVDGTGESVAVHFGTSSPFTMNNISLVKDGVSGAIIRPGTLGTTFPYTITPKGCPHTDTGPDVIVDGGGVPANP